MGMESKVILFLCANKPSPLELRMMDTLESRGGYHVELLYYDRGDSKESMPMSALVNQQRASSIVGPVGKNVVSKAINRCIVMTKFIRRIWTLKPDVIQALSFDMLLAARISTTAGFRPKIVFNLQDTQPWMVRRSLWWIQRWVYRGTDLFLVTSQGFISEYLRKFNLIGHVKPVVFVPNVPNERQFGDFVPRAASEVLTVGYVGLLRGEEGLRTLIRAVSKARETGADVRLLFAGMGPMKDLADYAAERYQFVDSLGPYQYDQEICEIYGKVDILYGIYDRSYDKKIHLAYRFCEAINCRIPIIVGEGTHMCEEVKRLKVGLCVALGDEDGLAEKLVVLCRSKERRANIARNCEIVRSKFVYEYYEERINCAFDVLFKAGGGSLR